MYNKIVARASCPLYRKKMDEIHMCEKKTSERCDWICVYRVVCDKKDGRAKVGKLLSFKSPEEVKEEERAKKNRRKTIWFSNVFEDYWG